MKITELRVHPLSIKSERVLWTAHEPLNQATLVLVEIRTDEGITGIGEVSTGPLNTVCELLKMLGPVITGLDPLAPDGIWKKLFSITTPRPGGVGSWDGLPAPIPRNQRPQFMAAMAGIDIALWDIRGKAANLPVFRLLGGTRTDVFTYAVGGFYAEGESPFDCANELGQFVADGFKAVKLKTGALSLQDELRRIRSVRKAIGPDVLLMLDLNAPFDVEACIRFSKAVEPYDIFWLEEPLHWYLQPSDFVRLAAASAIPLAHGEREWHRFTVREFIDSGAIGYVQFDCTRYGGFSEALRIAQYAEMKGVTVAPHTAAHLHAHLVSALGDAAFAAESVGRAEMHPIHHRIFHGGAAYRDGRVYLTEEAGFGLEVDWSAVNALKG